MRKIVALTMLVLTVILSSTLALADGSTHVVIGDSQVDFNRLHNGQPIGQPYVENGRAYIPVRAVSEDLGYKVDWLQATKTVVIEKESEKVELKIGESTALVNGVRKPIDVRDGRAVDTKALIKNGRTYVPVRFIAESLGETVEWYNNTVLINSDMTLQEGMLVLEGLIRHTNYRGVLGLQGVMDPNPAYSDPNKEFVILTLLKPKDINLPTACGDESIYTVNMISLIDLSQAKKYDGKIVKIGIDPNKTFWPSDTSLPLGEPRSYSYKILE